MKPHGSSIRQTETVGNVVFMYLILKGTRLRKVTMRIGETFEEIHEALGDGVRKPGVYVVELHLSTPVHLLRRNMHLKEIHPQKKIALNAIPGKSKYRTCYSDPSYCAIEYYIPQAEIRVDNATTKLP
jgi:hypothetical protein